MFSGVPISFIVLLKALLLITVELTTFMFPFLLLIPKIVEESLALLLSNKQEVQYTLESSEV